MTSNSLQLLSRGIVSLVLVIGSPMGLHAQSSAVADLALSTTPPLPALVFPGTSGVLQIAVTNLGPDDVGQRISVSSSVLEVRPGGAIEFDVSFSLVDPNGICTESLSSLDPIPGQRPIFVYAIQFSSAQALSTLTCAVRYSVHPLAAAQQLPIGWQVSSSSSIDPNSGNNAVNLVFNIAAPSAIPVPALSPMMRWLLFGVFVIVGVTFGRNRLRIRSYVPRGDGERR